MERKIGVIGRSANADRNLRLERRVIRKPPQKLLTRALILRRDGYLPQERVSG
jgi:hypothetical protein